MALLTSIGRAVGMATKKLVAKKRLHGDLSIMSGYVGMLPSGYLT